ncbi:thiamine phosphate synthase [Sinomicrobium weinanense]|uniref:Thiamine-phosphate synthase n=1 Tax=Sinomicrobium weinanense TaxID=2842200 RepID=A0A926Q5Y7_9FLAO|nr:thiamine phosphate synthase [Sinomicrobium weinanense]MBC9798490.1 thiamine phosphate synthase [Sinomicrobium weinanense]MBU3125237.1 thiamine phosphate synthase [Sinomicrobium weinanense]
MMGNPYILTIAGHDPCGGAGITADLKTMEDLGVHGLSACTALTVQSDTVLKKCEWTDAGLIVEQIEILMESYPVQAVKIGIIEDLEVLNTIVHLLKAKDPGIRIIWDPVLRSGSGYDFHNRIKVRDLHGILEHCDLVTPNYNEIRALSENGNTEKAIREITSRCHLFLKGGHRNDRKGMDILYRKGMPPVEFSPKDILNTDRHGSGCVLSSAIAAYLALGNSLEDSCEQAKEYTYRFLNNAPGRDRLKGITLQYISQGTTIDEHLKNIRNICVAGGDWIQLRIKDHPEKEVFEAAREAVKLCRAYGAKLIIDDHVSVAKAVGADGVHLGKNDLPAGEARKILGPGFIIGATANTTEDIEHLAGTGIDYIGLGPYRFTHTKKNLSPVLGLAGYSRIMEQLRQKKIYIPVVAIGGIGLKDMGPLSETGLQGVAVSSLLSDAKEPSTHSGLRETIARIQQYFNQTPEVASR